METKENSRGVSVIQKYCDLLPNTSGVYRMIGPEEEILYIGKAKNLKKRVSNYKNYRRLPNRIKRMIELTTEMEFVNTRTESEALLLESNLIKKYRPRYNILLRDDKSFPYILVTNEHDYPRILKFRGSLKNKSEYYGPFASVSSVDFTLSMLQKIFLLRSCSDSVFASRTRPCMLYQIKRCSAPCVGVIGKAEYDKLLGQARAFLTGDSQGIQKELAIEMEELSATLDFEAAALIRDRIKALTNVQSTQGLESKNLKNADLIAIAIESGQACIQVFFVRAGRNYGNRVYYPSQITGSRPKDIIEAFLGQFYSRHLPPKIILLNEPVDQKNVLEDALSSRVDYAVKLECPKRGAKRQMIQFVEENSRNAIARRLADRTSQQILFKGLAAKLGLSKVPNRIEIYDNSHISGSYPVGAMVVAGPEGFQKNSYRKYNIKTRNNFSVGLNNDDYGMMTEVLTRRLKKAKPINSSNQSDYSWPDLIIVDGGLGQLSAAQSVFDSMAISNIDLIAVAKGPKRNAGEEKIFMTGRDPVILDNKDPVLYFIQRLRDEAHRFAIGSHRKRREKNIQKSPLDSIDGIGKMRKRQLLNHFGSAKVVSEASLQDLEAVEGISRSIAKKIYYWFRPDS